MIRSTFFIFLLVMGVGALASARPRHPRSPGHSSSRKAAKSGSRKAAWRPSSGVAGVVKEAERPVAPPPASASAAPIPKGPTRIDFDDRLIEGQSNKSGAVYLYDRKDLHVESMVKQPSTFRAEIARGLFE